MEKEIKVTVQMCHAVKEVGGKELRHLIENSRVILWEGISNSDMNRKVVKDRIIDLKTIHHYFISSKQQGEFGVFIIKQHDPFIMNTFGNVIFNFTFF